MGRRKYTNKKARKLIEYALSLDPGARVRECQHGYLVYPSDKSVSPVTVPGTIGRGRAEANTRADIERAMRRT